MKVRMKRLIILIALVASPLVSFAQTSVGISIGIGHPNYYGQIEIGNVAPPPVMYAQPMIVQAAPVGVVYQPLYLRVPYEHHHDWRRYCSLYNACGRPVYFVEDHWYQNTYAPQYRNEHRDRDGYRGEERRDEYRGERRDEHRDERREDRRDDRHDER